MQTHTAIKVRKSTRTLSDLKQKASKRQLTKFMAPSEPVIAKEGVVKRAPSTIPLCKTQTISLPESSTEATHSLRSCHQRMPFMVDRTATDRSSMHSRVAALQTIELTVPPSPEKQILSSPCVADYDLQVLSFDERMQKRKASVQARMEELYTCTSASDFKHGSAISRTI